MPDADQTGTDSGLNAVRPESLEFLRDLMNVPSPSGYEVPAAKVFRRFVEPYADSVRTDVIGNVTAALGEDAPFKVMLAGHIDEIGFLVHYISDEGLLFFKPIGEHDSIVSVGQWVWVHGSGRPVPGVIGRVPAHLLSDNPADHRRMPELHELWIDIGAKTRREAEKNVDIGDHVTYHSNFRMLQGSRAAARGFDNKMGAYVVAEALRLLKEEGGLHPEVGVFAVGTTQEEVGFRGAQTSAYSLNAQVGLAVDVTHAMDIPSIPKERHGRADVGGGPLIASGPYLNPMVSRLLLEAAEEEGIPYQREAAPESTDTDATAMQVNRGGMATGLVAVALRYMHTPCELLDLDDVENCARLMAAFCRRVTPETDFTPR